ncbi:DinI-like family protein [Rodentibacter trehalosifermentans]|uniref:DinI family protein n=1 Tax=Rodentibacter trehalosifermentans TaxID=1908263 RepID=A0A1V3J434_9PAST|nr:DinI-like family protein [Rodentibacter trehalosifermentans]OOF49555.1 DinI family protein [Rodentibacter trehalosifermentans]OOF53472.1 DinI family protein [Rodentibacter trehalosifermentans]
MKKLDIRFTKERDSKKIAIQQKVIARLEEILPKRIAEKFNDVEVRIRTSSSQGFDISGFDKNDKDKFLEYLEELWNDDSLLDGIDEYS